MDKKEFTAKVRRLGPSQQASLRFKEGTEFILGAGNLFSLLRTNREVHLVTEADLETLLKIAGSGIFETPDEKRTYKVTSLWSARDTSLSLLARAIESITVENHAAVGITNQRKVYRDAAIQKMTEDVLTHDFIAEMQSWNIGIRGLWIEGPPATLMRFELLFQEKVIANASIDGWSGHILAGGNATDHIYQTPEQVRAVLRSEMERALETLTSL